MAFAKKSTSNSAFSTKLTTAAFSNSINSTTNTDEYTQMVTLLDSTAVRDINQISTYYANGNFDMIKAFLTQSEYNSLSSKLYLLKKPSSSKYESIRKILNTNLEGLLQSVNLYNNNISISSQSDIYKTRADMLNNIESLINQLNTLRGSVSLFPEQNFTIIPVEIKPEYLVYIKTYGYPENGIWDPDILGSILSSISLV